MTLWMIGAGLVYRFSLDLSPWGKRIFAGWSTIQRVKAFRDSASRLRTLHEMLDSGLLPSAEDWAGVREFPEPWGAFLHASFLDLRESGAPLVPSLKRAEETLLSQVDGLLEAKAKTAQALGQAGMGMALVPLFGFTLYRMMPGLDRPGSNFPIYVLAGTVYASFSSLWIIHLAEQARFGGLPESCRSWIFSVPATFERLFSLLAGGMPPDLAWRRCHEELCFLDPGLARAWGAEIWEEQARDPGTGAEALVIRTGTDTRKSIQLALLEGRSCRERLESVARSHRKDLSIRIREELELLPNRCLKPLFFFVLPPVLGLLFSALLSVLSELAD